MTREYSIEEIIAYVEQYESSGMSISKFARDKNIPISTFRGWIRLNKAMAFGEINLNQTPNITSDATIVPKKSIVFISNDIRIELKEGFNKDLLKRIVEVIANDN